MPKVIVVNGLKRSGKDYFSELLRCRLEREGKTVDVHSFADPMKFILSTTLNITEDELDNYKNNMCKLLVATEIEGSPSLNSITNMRKVLQNFGTDAMQTVFGKDVWVNLMKEKIEKSTADYFIIPDFRFPQEYIEGAISVQIVNEELDNSDTHASETSLNNFIFDFIVDNTGKPDLTSQISEFKELFL